MRSVFFIAYPGPKQKATRHVMLLLLVDAVPATVKQHTWWLHMRSVSTRRRTGTTGGSAIMEVVISSDTVSLSSTI